MRCRKLILEKVAVATCMPAPAALADLVLLVLEDGCRRRGTGQAGEVVELLQEDLPGRGDGLGVYRRHGHVVDQVRADLVNGVGTAAGGVLVKGLPGSRMRSGSSVLESTERVRTEAKRALAPGV